MSQIKKRIILEGGKLHDVGYRPFLLRKARELNIQTYDAENIKKDGKEMIMVSFAGSEKQVKEFLDFAKENYPANARVSGVKEAEPPEYVMPIDNYDKVLSAEQQNKVIQTGLEMVEMQKHMLQKQDQTVEKLDSFQKETIKKQDQTIALQKQTVEKLDSFHQDTVHKFDRMDAKYDKVSDKMDSMDKTLKELTKAILKLAEKTVA